MTPDQIREWNRSLDKHGFFYEFLHARASVEVAAQLAELNQTMTGIASMLENINDAIRSGMCH